MIYEHTIQGHKFMVNTDKGIVSTDKGIVHLEIAALAAGPDAWMREIEVPCVCCGGMFKLKSSDSAMYCQPCYEEDEE